MRGAQPVGYCASDITTFFHYSRLHMVKFHLMKRIGATIFVAHDLQHIVPTNVRVLALPFVAHDL